MEAFEVRSEVPFEELVGVGRDAKVGETWDGKAGSGVFRNCSNNVSRRLLSLGRDTGLQPSIFAEGHRKNPREPGLSFCSARGMDLR